MIKRCNEISVYSRFKFKDILLYCPNIAFNTPLVALRFSSRGKVGWIPEYLMFKSNNIHYPYKAF